MARLLNGDGFMPHGHCYLWNPTLVALHVISDGLTGLAYVTIPFTLLYFAQRRRDFPFSWMLVWFGAFIVACGATHFLEIYTLWVPAYWLSGVVKAFTALASVVTAALLVRLVPHALALPTQRQLHEAHEQRAAALAERHQLEERLHLLIESVQDYAIYLVSPSGEVASWNFGAQRLLGYAAEEILGQPADRFYPPEDLAQHVPQATWTEALQDGRAETEGFRLRKDGSRFWANCVTTPVRDGGGRLIGFATVTRDLTREREHDEGLRRAHRELEQATVQLTATNRELEAFSYSVAHDLRSPLRGMSGFAQVLIEDYAAALDAGGLDALHEIQSNVARMSELIDDLLSLSKTTRSELHRERIDLGEIARGVVGALRAAGQALPGTLSRPTAPDLVIGASLQVEADRRLTAILLANLLGNAFKFTAKASAPRVELGRQASSSVFYVRDNGAGFEMAHAGKLFAPFQRLHPANEFPGTGIGLATAQRIVARHGGRIWAEAEVGRGATFFFTLGGEGA